jgi:hypothetical protein
MTSRAFAAFALASTFVAAATVVLGAALLDRKALGEARG